MFLTEDQERMALVIAERDVHEAFFYCQVMAEKNQNPESWCPGDFEATPFEVEGNQVTIFFKKVDEPPEPEGSIAEYLKSWENWQQKTCGKSHRLRHQNSQGFNNYV